MFAYPARDSIDTFLTCALSAINASISVSIISARAENTKIEDASVS
jgi:hypothetical protein